MGEGVGPLRQADELDGAEHVGGNRQGAGIGKPNVLGGQDHQPSRDELGILAGIDPDLPLDGVLHEGQVMAEQPRRAVQAEVATDAVVDVAARMREMW